MRGHGHLFIDEGGTKQLMVILAASYCLRNLYNSLLNKLANHQSKASLDRGWFYGKKNSFSDCDSVRILLSYCCDSVDHSSMAAIVVTIN